MRCYSHLDVWHVDADARCQKVDALFFVVHMTLSWFASMLFLLPWHFGFFRLRNRDDGSG